MHYFIDATGGLWALAPDGSQDHLIKSDWRPATNQEVLDIQNPAPTSEDLAANIRADRDRRLIDADHAINRLEDSGGESTAAWRKYRQELRDITAQQTFPHSVTWPEIPQN